MQLWPFQKDLITKLRGSLVNRFRAPLLVSPTGSGKTVMFVYLISKLAAAGLRTVILVHRKELLDQISETLKDFQVQHTLIGPGIHYNGLPLTHVASVFSVVRRLKYIKIPDYVIIDEAHHAIEGSTWNKVLEHWKALNPKLRVIGVTATPERLSGEGLDSTFDTMVMGPTVAKLIQDKFLSPYKMFAPPRAVDLSGVHRRMGDYVKSEVEAAMDKPSIMGDVVAHYKKHLNGAPTVGFCVSVAHTHHVADTFKLNGFRAAAIDGKMSKKDRAQIIKDFASGQLNYLASCDLISEGFDVPGMMGCQNLRPTESLAMALQQWGRVLRYVEGKTAIILDHVGNSARHGLPDQDRQWSLQGSRRNGNKRDPDDIAIRQCRMCGAVNPTSNSHCSECGAEFKFKPRKIAETAGDLEEIKEAEKLKFIKTRAAAKDLDALIEIGRMRGMKNPRGWAGHVMAARGQKRRRT